MVNRYGGFRRYNFGGRPRFSGQGRGFSPRRRTYPRAYRAKQGRFGRWLPYWQYKQKMRASYGGSRGRSRRY